MSLISRIRDYFNPRPALRNKRGGMAYVRGLRDLIELNGRIVKTVRVESDNKWCIEPQQFVSNIPAGLVFVNGTRSVGGEIGFVTAIADDCLVPLRDPGEDAQDESLAWIPPVPTEHKETV